MKRLIPILLLLVSGVAHSENTIVGAFGQTLDTVFNPLDPTLDKSQEPGSGKYCFDFVPKKPEPMFDTYRFCVWPVERKIFRIYFSGQFEDRNQCRWKMLVIESLLQKKYPELSRVVISSDAYGGGHLWNQYTQKDGRRAIDVQCIGLLGEKYEDGTFEILDDYKLIVEYSLWPWETRLYKERLEKGMSEIDDTNF
jgi:hypothetical protein